MNKIKAPNGAQVNFEKLVSDIQNSSFSNLKEALSLFIKSSGLSLSIDSGTVGDSFAPTLTSTQISIAPGKGITQDYTYLKSSSTRLIDIPLLPDSENAFLVSLKYKTIGSSPVKSLNAFVYDVVSAGAHMRNTVFTSSLEVVTREITGPSFSTLSDEVPLAAVWRKASSFAPGTLTDYPQQQIGDNTMVDLRESFRMILDENLLDEKSVLFKDRDSTGDRGVSGDIDFNGTASFSDKVFIGDFEASVPSSDLLIKQYGQTIFTLAPDGDLFSKKVRAEEMFLLKGGNYVPVATVPVPPSMPLNLRVDSVQPFEQDPQRALVTFKWNWEGLNATGTTGTTVQLNEPADFFSSEDQTRIIEDAKDFVFSNGESFKVLSMRFNSGTNRWELELSGTPTPEIAPTTAKIIDNDVDGYKLETHLVGLKRAVMELSGETKVSNRTTELMLLNKPYDVSLKATQGGLASGAATLTFTPQLEVATEPGTITLSPNKAGFVVEMDGFPLVGGKKPQEFEIVYSQHVEISSESVMDDDDVKFTRQKTPYKKLQITTPEPKRYWVGVRPLQNGQPVGPSVFGEVVSGGGGISPQEQILYEDTISIRYVKMTSVGEKEDSAGRKLHEFKSISAETAVEEEIPASLFYGKKIAEVEDVSDVLTFDWATGLEKSSDLNGDVSSAFRTIDGNDFITFTATDVAASNNIPLDESTWAYIRKDPSQNVSLPSGKAIYFKTTVAVPNWGKSKIHLYLKEAGGAILAEKKISKNTLYSRSGNTSYYNVDLDYENRTGETKLVYWEIRVSGFIGKTGAAPELCWIAVNTEEGFSGFEEAVSGLFVDFGENPFDLSLKTSANTTSSTKHLEPTTVLKDSKSQNLVYAFKSEDSSTIQKGKTYILGGTKQCRFINEKELTVDFVLTAVQFIAGSVTGVSATNPGIIRIYPKGSESSAAMLEVTGGEGSFYKNINLEVRRSGSQRGFVLDGFDTSLDNPNNRCSLEGQVIVYGKPAIRDRD